VDTNLAQNPHCVNGVNQTELDRCIAMIHDEGCTGEDINTQLACRSRNLCLK